MLNQVVTVAEALLDLARVKASMRVEEVMHELGADASDPATMMNSLAEKMMAAEGSRDRRNQVLYKDLDYLLDV